MSVPQKALPNPFLSLVYRFHDIYAPPFGGCVFDPKCEQSCGIIIMLDSCGCSAAGMPPLLLRTPGGGSLQTHPGPRVVSLATRVCVSLILQFLIKKQLMSAVKHSNVGSEIYTQPPPGVGCWLLGNALRGDSSKRKRFSSSPRYDYATSSGGCIGSKLRWAEPPVGGSGIIARG
jgi:hypothetical protein